MAQLFRHPCPLSPGDRVAIVSPSWGGPYLFPAVYEKGLELLRTKLRLEPVEYATARMAPEELARSPQRRAADINTALADESIGGLIASIGGDDSVRILPYLDIAILTAHPKLMMGYSDFSTLLTYGAMLGNVTVHGPSIMAGIAQLDALGDDYAAHLREALFSARPLPPYRPYSFFVEGYPDWSQPEQVGQTGPPQTNPGWDWLQAGVPSQGYFWGGCFGVLEMLKGTDFWPERSFFDEVILVLETSEMVPSPDQVQYMLRNYGAQTILERIRGLVLGRPRGYSAAQKQALRQNVRQVVVEEYGRTDLPIVLDFDLGHTDPQRVVPFGVRTQIDPQARSIALLEPIFAPK